MKSISRLENMHFNSQPHKEADGNDGDRWRDRLISTHSLTRRLTAVAGESDSGSDKFQLTASQGG